MVVGPHYHRRQVFQASRIASLDPSDVNTIASLADLSDLFPHVALRNIIGHVTLLVSSRFRICNPPSLRTMAGNPTSKNLIAVVIGAVVLFGAISVIPIFIMRRHRRRAAARHANELHGLQVNGTIRQVGVQRWLDQQQTTATATSENMDRYADESCPICLTSLFAPSAFSLSSSTIHNPQGRSNQTLPLPSVPEAAHTLHPNQCTTAIISPDDDRTRPPRYAGRSPAGDEEGGECRNLDSSGIMVLNRCAHAFHARCLASWFEYRQYRCPICADVLNSE
ncbi:hypothetical protein BJX63DRAFT_268806 [Aspergillus granulosus]|uniref:RING-type domain-containing protein n=1 Tax=Aspergillus granulosus TaxID=176169 RepID=A0ABR4HAI2_9EURO